MTLHHTIAYMANPTANHGSNALESRIILRRLTEAAKDYSLKVTDVTHHTAEESLEAAREAVAEGACALVVAGGDGMVSLGVNVVGGAHTPLGIIPTGSGNDFARALGIPLNDEKSAIRGIVGALACKTSVHVDLGAVSPVDSATTEPHLFAGMLSCGLDANVNLMANRSSLPTGGLRYLDAVLYQLRHMTRYGYQVKATAEDGTLIERDIVTPMFTIANSRFIGSGIGISPYSRLNDGLLDMVWMNHTPNPAEIARALPHLYDGRLLESGMFDWMRVKNVTVRHSSQGALPPILMADGDEAGVAPVCVTPRADALRVLMPPAAARAFTIAERAR